jgi:NitT/TauT family transport system substrate-binding protein
VQGTELGFIAFNSDFLKANEDAVVRFLAAYLKASRELDNGGWKDPAIKAIVAKYTGSPPELFDNIAFTVRPANGEIDLASVRDQEAFFRKQGSLTYEGDIDLSKVYRTDLLEKANKLLEGT